MKKIDQFIPMDIYAHTADSTQIAALLAEKLPTGLAAKVEYVGIRGGARGQVLHLRTDSAACRHQLRFYRQALLQTLQERQLAPVAEIKISVDMSASRTPKPKAAVDRPSISACSREMLRTTAQGVSDKRLRQALEKLANIAG